MPTRNRAGDSNERFLIMPDFGGLADKAKDMAGGHEDKVNQGIDKAGDTVDEKLSLIHI